MYSFKQFISEAVTRADLISHYNEKHGGHIDTYPPSHEWHDENNYKMSGGFRSHLHDFYPHKLDPKKLATLDGRNGEHLHVGRQDSPWNHEFEKVKSSMKKNGFWNKDPEHGHAHGSMIRVFHDGTAKVHEGNKRMRAAAALGHRTVPVRWEYQGGSINNPDAHHPVDFMHDDDLKSLRMEVRAKRLGLDT